MKEEKMKEFRIVDHRTFDVLAETEEEAKGLLEDAVLNAGPATEGNLIAGIRFIEAKFTIEIMEGKERIV